MENQLEYNINELLSLKGETKNVDFKEKFNWKTAIKSEKCEIIKDILAFANSQDGGKIVFGVRDHDYFAIGLSDDDYNSFDQTSIHQLLNEYASPSFDCKVTKPMDNGNKFVIIDIPEYEEIPIICKADIQDNKHKFILKKGNIYIRGNDAASRTIQSAEEMREFIRRAVLKKKNDFLRDFQLILENNKPLILKPAEEYKKIITADEKEITSIFNEKKISSFWKIIAYPTFFQSDRIQSIGEIRKFVSESQSQIFSPVFPHVAEINGEFEKYQLFNDSIEFSLDYRRRFEYSKIYQSGLFVCQVGYNGDKMFYEQIIQLLTQYFIFLGRFYGKILKNDESINIKISLIGCKDTQLISVNFLNGFNHMDEFNCKLNDIIAYDKSLKLIDIATNFLKEAAKAINKIFELCECNVYNVESIMQMQKEFLEKKH